MRKFYWDKSPAVLAMAAAAALVPAVGLFGTIVTDSMFRGDYLKVLPVVAFTFVLAFLFTWPVISEVVATRRQLRPTGRPAKVPKPDKAVAEAFGSDKAGWVINVLGSQQAGELARLMKAGRWGLDLRQITPETMSFGLSGKEGVTDADLSELAGLRSLMWLSLSDTQISDAGLMRLTHLTRLQSLILRSTGVTDRGLVHLKALPGLQRLDVDATAVTTEGLRNAGLLDKKISLTELTQKGKAEGTLVFPMIPPLAKEPYSRANALLMEKQYRRAEALAHKALAATEAFGADTPWISRCLMTLGMCENLQGKYADGEVSFQRAMENSEKALGPVSRDMERILWNLGQSQRAQGKYVPAESNLKRSLALAEKHSCELPEHHEELALVYVACGRLEAKTHFRKSVDGYETALKSEGKDLTVLRQSYGGFLRNFAGELRRRGQDAKAKELEARAGAVESGSR